VNPILHISPSSAPRFPHLSRLPSVEFLSWFVEHFWARSGLGYGKGTYPVQMRCHHALCIDRRRLAPQLCHFADNAHGFVGEGVEELGVYARGREVVCHFVWLKEAGVF
jgi:hypothetical protein